MWVVILVPGAKENKHYASEDPRDLVVYFVETLKAIAYTRERIMLDQFKDVLTEIEDTFSGMVLIEEKMKLMMVSMCSWMI